MTISSPNPPLFAVSSKEEHTHALKEVSYRLPGTLVTALVGARYGFKAGIAAGTTVESLIQLGWDYYDGNELNLNRALSILGTSLNDTNRTAISFAVGGKLRGIISNAILRGILANEAVGFAHTALDIGLVATGLNTFTGSQLDFRWWDPLIWGVSGFIGGRFAPRSNWKAEAGFEYLRELAEETVQQGTHIKQLTTANLMKSSFMASQELGTSAWHHGWRTKKETETFANNHNHYQNESETIDQPIPLALPLAAGAEGTNFSTPVTWGLGEGDTSNVVMLSSHQAYNASFDPTRFSPDQIGAYRNRVEDRMADLAAGGTRDVRGSRGARGKRGGNADVLLGILDRHYPPHLKVYEALVLEQAAGQERSSAARAVLEHGRDRAPYIAEAHRLSEGEARELFELIRSNIIEWITGDSELETLAEILENMPELLGNDVKSRRADRAVVAFDKEAQTFDRYAGDPIYRVEALGGILYLLSQADPTGLLRQKRVSDLTGPESQRVNQHFFRKKGGEDVLVAGVPVFCERLTFLRENCDLVESTHETQAAPVDVGDLMASIGVGGRRGADVPTAEVAVLDMDTRGVPALVRSLKRSMETLRALTSDPLDERNFVLDRLVATPGTSEAAVLAVLRRLRETGFLTLETLYREEALLFEDVLRGRGELAVSPLATRELELVRQVLTQIGEGHPLLGRLSGALRSVTLCPYLPDSIRALYYVSQNPRRLETELARQQGVWNTLDGLRRSGELPHEATLLVGERPEVSQIIDTFLEQAAEAHARREQEERDAAMQAEELEEVIVVEAPRPAIVPKLPPPPRPPVPPTHRTHLRKARETEEVLLTEVSDTSGEERLGILRENLAVRLTGYEEGFGTSRVTELAGEAVTAAETLLARPELPIENRIEIAEQVFRALDCQQTETVEELTGRLHEAHDLVDAQAMRRVSPDVTRDILIAQWERHLTVMESMPGAHWRSLGQFVRRILVQLRTLPPEKAVAWVQAHSLPQTLSVFRRLQQSHPTVATAVADWVGSLDLKVTTLDTAARRLDGVAGKVQNAATYLDPSVRGEKIFSLAATEAAVLVRHVVPSSEASDVHLHQLFRRRTPLDVEDLHDQLRGHPREAKVFEFLERSLTDRGLKALGDLERLFARHTPYGLFGNATVARLPHARYVEVVNNTLAAVSKVMAAMEVSTFDSTPLRRAGFRILRSYFDLGYVRTVVDSYGVEHSGDNLVWPQTADVARCLGGHKEFQALAGVLSRTNAWTRLVDFDPTRNFDPDWVLAPLGKDPGSIAEVKSSYKKGVLDAGDIGDIFHQLPKYLQRPDLSRATIDYYLIWNRLAGRRNVPIEDVITQGGVRALTELVSDNGRGAPFTGDALTTALRRIHIHLLDYQDPSQIITVQERPFINLWDLTSQLGIDIF